MDRASSETAVILISQVLRQNIWRGEQRATTSETEPGHRVTASRERRLQKRGARLMACVSPPPSQTGVASRALVCAAKACVPGTCTPGWFACHWFAWRGQIAGDGGAHAPPGHCTCLAKHQQQLGMPHGSAVQHTARARTPALQAWRGAPHGRARRARPPALPQGSQRAQRRRRRRRRLRTPLPGEGGEAPGRHPRSPPAPPGAHRAGLGRLELTCYLPSKGCCST